MFETDTLWCNVLPRSVQVVPAYPRAHVPHFVAVPVHLFNKKITQRFPQTFMHFTHDCRVEKLKDSHKYSKYVISRQERFEINIR